MSSTVDVHMRETDAFSWTMEKDPVLRMPVMAVAILDGTPDWDEVVRRMERVSRAVPLFRQRVVTTPAKLAPPKWVVDDRFDLSWHVRRVVAPAPGTSDALLDLAAKLAMAAFDLERPLWEVWLVDGLENGRSAWLAKVHHTLTDGIGGMQLLSHLFDVDGVPLAPAPAATQPDGAEIGTLTMLRSGAEHDLHQLLGLARGAVSVTTKTLRHARHDPVAAIAGATATWRTLIEAVSPTGDRLSPVMTGRGLRRRYAAFDVPLDGLRRAGRTVDGTVNDAFLTAVTGGLRRYHQLHDSAVYELRLTLPIDVRESGDAEAGNRIALIRLTVPVEPEDAAARMAEIRRRVERWKDAPGLAYIEAAYALVNNLPPAYLQGLARHVDFVASNVPAFPMPVRLAGPRLEALYAFGPTGGTGVNVTMMSYAGTVYVGVDVDTEAVPDVDAFVTCLRAGFDEVVGLAGADTEVGATA
ncbi:MAG TPA: wax ester/triacylglycerol synthase domain-containing protein [Mycobacteriales bacterium]|nr:wax ester/triacylglycerol synthase domain-containing protein [Mycobacteriales bacterium]